jgi:hypothetical protein
MRLDGIATGEMLRTHLRTALQHSLDADTDFTRWAGTVQAQGCRGSAPLTSDYDAAQLDSQAAGTAKTEVVAVWNPVAVTFGLAQRSRNDI